MPISAPNLIAENSAATPGLWNSMITKLWQNDLSLSGGTVGQSNNTLNPESGNTIFATSSVFSVKDFVASAATFHGAVSLNTLQPESGNTIFVTASQLSNATVIATRVLVGPAVPAAVNTQLNPANMPGVFARDGGPARVVAVGATNQGVFDGVRMNTSFASPTTIATNEAFVQVSGRAFDGATFPQGANMQFIAASTWSTTERGTFIRFQLVPIGSTAVATALLLNGDLSITAARGGTFGGGISATTASLTDQLSGTSAVLTGPISATTAAFAGGLSAYTSQFSGQMIVNRSPIASDGGTARSLVHQSINSLGIFEGFVVNGQALGTIGTGDVTFGSAVSSFGVKAELAGQPLVLGTNTGGIAQTISNQTTTFVGKTINSDTMRLRGYPVAGLPAGVQGDMSFCTDLLLPAFLAVAAGGGAVVGPVFYNGTNWVTI